MEETFCRYCRTETLNAYGRCRTCNRFGRFDFREAGSEQHPRYEVGSNVEVLFRTLSVVETYRDGYRGEWTGQRKCWVIITWINGNPRTEILL